MVPLNLGNLHRVYVGFHKHLESKPADLGALEHYGGAVKLASSPKCSMRKAGVLLILVGDQMGVFQN